MLPIMHNGTRLYPRTYVSYSTDGQMHPGDQVLSPSKAVGGLLTAGFVNDGVRHISIYSFLFPTRCGGSCLTLSQDAEGDFNYFPPNAINKWSGAGHWKFGGRASTLPSLHVGDAKAHVYREQSRNG